VSGMPSSNAPPVSRQVVILQYRLFHYRRDLFERLRAVCRERGIRLDVVAGQPFGREKDKLDEGHLPWAHKVTNWYFPIKEKKDLCWQPVPKELKRCDLLVVMQENRLLSNYWWMVKRRFGGPKVAFWGHGRDYQTNAPGGLRERWKRAMINQVDWWFAYTALSAAEVRAAGFPPERITCLNNAIDTAGFRREVRDVGERERSAMREALGWKGAPGPTALFCGSLYPDKKLDFLFDACDLIRARIPGFKLVVIGDGSSATLVRKAAASRSWCAYVGAKRGRDKAALFSISDIVLNPGLVGLHVLDAFAAGLPMVTTRGAKHSPEIAYLESGRNGLITGDGIDEYADAVVSLLSDPGRLEALRRSALEDAATYTVEQMADNFADGLAKCLGLSGSIGLETSALDGGRTPAAR